MPVFEYKALNQKGKNVNGVITADGLAAARQKLSQDMIFPMEIKEVQAEVKSSPLQELLFRLPFWQKINPFEVTTALRQFATLASSSLPILDCMNGLIDQIEQPRLKKIFSQIKEKVSEGSPLYQALSAHPAIFSNIHVNLVRAGEAGGALGLILLQLADFSEKRLKFKKKLESALAYPAFLILVSAGMLTFLVSFVMPKIVGLFKSMHVALPLLTRGLIRFTGFMQHFWWLVLAVLAGIIAVVFLWLKTEKGARTWDRLRLHLPFAGKLHYEAVVARFCRTLSILLKSGIPLIEALEMAGHAMGNRIMEDQIREISKLVAEGEALSGPLKRVAHFPPLVIQLVRAGEQSGELENMLAKAAEVYEDHVETGIATLMSIIEPLIILGMGIIVLVMVLSILLPILDLTSSIRR
jgi:general secretion pathway protein F